MRLKLLILPALVLTAGAQAATFSDRLHGFSVTIPPGWKQSTPAGTAVLFTSPRALSGYRPTINVLVQTMRQPLTQQQYQNRSLANLSAFIPEAKVVSTGPLTFGGVKGNQTTYTGRQGQRQMYWISTYVIRGKNVYLITGATLKGTEKDLVKVMQPFVKSFKLKG